MSSNKWSKENAEKARSLHVFSYFDGEKDRKVDVTRVWITIQKELPPEVIGNSTQMSAENQIKVLDIIRKELHIKPFDEESGEGRTDGEVVEMIDDIMNTVAGLKKNIKSKRTSPSFTEPKS